MIIRLFVVAVSFIFLSFKLHSQIENPEYGKRLKSQKTCKCRNLTSWDSKYQRRVIYKWVSDSTSENGLNYHKVKFDYSMNKGNFSAYLRIVNDTIFWLDSEWNSPHSSEQIKNEQKFLVLSDKDTNNLKLVTSTILFGSCNIALSAVKKTTTDKKYYYTIFTNTKNLSDYVIPTQIVISKNRWIESITIETSFGDKKVCRFF